jgi:uncharacterized membrane protein YgcG
MKNSLAKKAAKRFFFGVIFLMCSFAVPLQSIAQGIEERINNFDTRVIVQTSGTLLVTEKIFYNFSANERHGIYREIPKTYKSVDSDGNERKYKLIVKNFEVHSPTAPTELAFEHTSDIYRFRIGNPDSTITGAHLYRLSYEVENAVGFYKDFDEVYWNATGNSWPVPIIRASLTIELSEPLAVEDGRYACYKGELFKDDSCDSLTLLDNAGGARFSSLRLSPFEGLTGAVSFQKGIVPEIERERVGLPSFLVSLIFSLSVVILGVAWFLLLRHAFKNWKSRREPNQKKTVVRQYDSPSMMSPSAVGYVVDKRVDNHDITAEIVYLAEKGFIHILSLPKKTLFSTKPQFYLLKSRDSGEGLREYQKLILSSLFCSSYALNKDEQNELLRDIQDSKKLKTDRKKLLTKVSSSYEITALKDLKSKFHVDLEKVKKSLESFTVSEGYIEKFSQRPLVMYFLSSFIIILLTTFVVSYPPAELVSGIVSFVTIFILILVGSFAFPLRRRTQKGISIKQHALGLKEYLSVAEKDRLDFHFNPKNNPRLFEALLPFAIALQVDTQWAKGLEDLFVEPDWYTDAGHTHLNVTSLYSSFSSFNSVAASSYSAPSSSGSSGGGFSGGGGGGGGGGSW